jgi:hypothetical protein
MGLSQSAAADTNAGDLGACTNDFELVIRASKELESILTLEFGAGGRGLHEKITTARVGGALPDGMDFSAYGGGGKGGSGGGESKSPGPSTSTSNSKADAEADAMLAAFGEGCGVAGGEVGVVGVVGGEGPGSNASCAEELDRMIRDPSLSTDRPLDFIDADLDAVVIAPPGTGGRFRPTALPPQLARKMRFLATIRNKLIHENDFNVIPDREGFLRAFGEAVEELRVILMEERRRMMSVVDYADQKASWKASWCVLFPGLRSLLAPLPPPTSLLASSLASTSSTHSARLRWPPLASTLLTRSASPPPSLHLHRLATIALNVAGASSSAVGAVGGLAGKAVEAVASRLPSNLSDDISVGVEGVVAPITSGLYHAAGGAVGTVASAAHSSFSAVTAAASGAGQALQSTMPAMPAMPSLSVSLPDMMLSLPALPAAPWGAMLNYTLGGSLGRSPVAASLPPPVFRVTAMGVHRAMVELLYMPDDDDSGEERSSSGGESDGGGMAANERAGGNRTEQLTRAVDELLLEGGAVLNDGEDGKSEAISSGGGGSGGSGGGDRSGIDDASSRHPQAAKRGRDMHIWYTVLSSTAATSPLSIPSPSSSSPTLYRGPFSVATSGVGGGETRICAMAECRTTTRGGDDGEHGDGGGGDGDGDGGDVLSSDVVEMVIPVAEKDIAGTSET